MGLDFDVAKACDADTSRVIRKLERTAIFNDNDKGPSEGQWRSRYRFFSNGRVKDSHQVFSAARMDPLRVESKPGTPTVVLQVPPEHRWAVRAGLNGSYSEPSLSEVNSRLSQTLTNIGRVVASTPSRRSPHRGTKYMFFGGGGHATLRYRKDSLDDPWLPWWQCQG